MNVIIQALIFSSFIFEAGFGLIVPIFAVFITDQIVGGSVAVAGYAAGVYWILKAILQIPVAKFLDAHDGEIDDFWALCAGHVLMGLAVFLYIYARTPIHIYLLQALLSLGGALAVPSWYAMFLRHVDRRKEGFEWSVNSSLSYGLGTGGAGALGGFLASRYGFNFIFITAAILIWLTIFILFFLRQNFGVREKPPVPKLPYPL